MIMTPPPSPVTMPLTIPSMANVFVRLRRARDRSKAESLHCSSGDVSYTHPSLSGEGATCRRRVPVVHCDLFTCKGGVDVPKLLRAARMSLLEKAEFLGANVLVEESWEVIIRMPKEPKHGLYRVRVRYLAAASRSSRLDPQKPVALDKVRNIPGLMTILEREEVTP